MGSRRPVAELHFWSRMWKWIFIPRSWQSILFLPLSLFFVEESWTAWIALYFFKAAEIIREGPFIKSAPPQQSWGLFSAQIKNSMQRPSGGK